MKNRFMLAPMTNCQSHEDGRLSEEEFRWLIMRTRGGFAVTMTGAASVTASGKALLASLASTATSTSRGHRVLQPRSISKHDDMVANPRYGHDDL